MARPRPVFRARRVLTPPGFGCAWLAALAFAPPHPGGVRTEGRKTNYRKHLTPAAEAGGEGFVLEAVGAALARFGALVGLGLKDL